MVIHNVLCKRVMPMRNVRVLRSASLSGPTEYTLSRFPKAHGLGFQSIDRPVHNLCIILTCLLDSKRVSATAAGLSVE